MFLYDNSSIIHLAVDTVDLFASEKLDWAWSRLEKNGFVFSRIKLILKYKFCLVIISWFMNESMFKFYAFQAKR